jgi:hypothetical protein
VVAVNLLMNTLPTISRTAPCALLLVGAILARQPDQADPLPPLEKAIDQLKSKDATERAKGARGLAELTDEKVKAKALMVLAPTIVDEKDRTTRLEMLNAIRKLDPRLHRVIDAILFDKNSLPALSIPETFENLSANPKAKPLVPFLLACLKNDASSERVDPAWSLVAYISPDDPEVFQEVLARADTFFKSTARDRDTMWMTVLPRICKARPADTEKCVDLLIRAAGIKSRMGIYPEFARKSFVALGQIGPPARKAVPMLKAWQSSPGSGLRMLATSALEAIDR